jgi:hypothetical protein
MTASKTAKQRLTDVDVNYSGYASKGSAMSDTDGFWRDLPIK